MRRSRKKLFFCGLLIFIFHWGNGQEVDNQLWINYAVKVQVTENLSYGGDAGIRGLVSNEDWNQYIVRPNVAYRFNQIVSVSGAAAFFKTFNVSSNNVQEFRLHQEVIVKWPDFTLMALFYRVRIEERSFYFPEEPNEFNVRARFLVGAESQDFECSWI